uniref:Kelch repeat protein n=1 Tax=Bionectria ochroleuca TaxID=29856 RepID=A0A8H7TWG5_BIOOC
MLQLSFLTYLWLAAGLVAGEDLTIYQRRFWHNAAILGDNLYIDGGSMSNHINGSLPEGTEYNTRAVLNTTVISLKNDWNNTNVEKSYHGYGQTTLGVKIFALWTNQKLGQIFRWGGERTDDSQVTKDYPVMWYLKNDTSNSDLWYETPADEDNPPGVSGTPVTCGGKHLYFGGSVSNKTYAKVQVNKLSKGVLEYNPDTKVWTRYENSSYPKPYGTHKMGEAVCIEDLISKPVVLLFGGRNTNPDTGDTQPNALSTVTLYDVDTHEWHEQNTTGLAGTHRSEFCSVGAKGKNGTYEIYAYGGDGKGGTQGSVCILTLPDFHWVCPTALSNGPARLHHVCVTRKNQMISVGGARSFFNFSDPDPWGNGLGILDLTELKWKNDYNASAPEYDSPDVIKEWYADAAREQPTWASDSIKAMFSTSSDNTDNNQNNTNSTTDNSDGQSTESTGGGTNVGAIAGGTVGGVALIALIAFAIWFFRRRPSTDIPEKAELEETSPQHYSSPHAHNATPASYATHRSHLQSSHTSHTSPSDPSDPTEHLVSSPSTTLLQKSYSLSLPAPTFQDPSPGCHEIAADVPRVELDGGVVTAVSPNSTWKPDGW